MSAQMSFCKLVGASCLRLTIAENAKEMLLSMNHRIPQFAEGSSPEGHGRSCKRRKLENSLLGFFMERKRTHFSCISSGICFEGYLRGQIIMTDLLFILELSNVLIK